VNDHPRDLSQAANRVSVPYLVAVVGFRRARRLLAISVAALAACAPEFTGSPSSNEQGGSAGSTAAGADSGGKPTASGGSSGRRGEDGGGGNDEEGEGGEPPAASGGATGVEGGSSGSGGAPDTTCGLTHRSCGGLPRTCGVQGSDDCCSSGLVSGGSFKRSHEAIRPATLSTFRLDTYEVTVGRFRKFVEAYPASKPVAGCGKNPKNPSDPGWESAWDSSLPASSEALRAALACSEQASWSDSAGNAEALPIGCLSWFEAYAFCIWDGGRLPTEAEWNYAAAGGADERPYPWSTSANDETIDGTYATYCSATPCISKVVGSRSPKGDGKWGHADLAGSVREWVQDYYLTYSSQCLDCAALTEGSMRARRGGSYAESPPFLLTGYRDAAVPNHRIPNVGVRCARAP
jgi:sulfatase modifying factor 1